MSNDSGPANTDRRVPYDGDAETALLGAMLLSPEALEIGLGRLLASSFYIVAHGHAFDAMRRLYEIGEDVDAVTVAAELGGMGLLGETGGPSALVELMSQCPSTKNAASYAAVVERKWRQRQMLGAGLEIAEKAREGVDWHETLGRVLGIGSENGVVHSPSTLELVDLAPIIAGDLPVEIPLWLRLTDGRGLLYPGRVHDLHAPPSVGKTWIALAAARDVLRAGGNVLLLDYEDTAATTIARLRNIGTADELLSDPARFQYVNPSGGMGLAEKAHLDRILSELEPDLIILDGVAMALGRCGFDENSNADVVAFAALVIAPLRASGAAVLLLDHVTKSSEHRARGARGAGAKLGILDGASYEVRLTRAFSRHKPGAAKLIVAKDRIGQVGGIGQTVAEITFTPSADGSVLDLVVLPPSGADSSGGKLTGLMETLSRRLELASAPLTASSLFGGLGSEHRFLDSALGDLVADGNVRKEERSGSTDLYRSETPYREPFDDDHSGSARRTRRTKGGPESGMRPIPAGDDTDGSEPVAAGNVTRLFPDNPTTEEF